MKKYENLKSNKKAYVICAVGQSYIDSTEIMIKALMKFSDYPVILYYSNGVVNYEYDNLIKQPFRPLDIKVNSEHSLKLLTTLKAEVTLNSIKRYNLDYIIMLDSDIIVTPNIDSVFSKYENEIENYPIFIKYSWDIITVMGRPLVSDYIQNIIGVQPPKIPAVCSCMCIANKNCVSFLEDWKYWCENYDLIKFHYVENKDIYFDFNDESIVNALLWKYGATKVLPTNLQWAWKHESVKFTFDFYDGKTEKLNKHESLQDTHWRIPEKYEVPYGLSVIPMNIEDLWGFHGPKDIDEIELIINEIENKFKKKNMKIVQLGACKGNDHVTELVKSRNDVEFLLLVEPNPKVHQSLKECYDFFPNTIIEKLAIVADYTQGKNVEMFFSEADSMGGYQVTSLYKNHIELHYPYQKDSIESFVVKSITLEDLFQKHNILELDYLFVDIEGMDEDVILNLDLKKYNIKNICVEYIHLKNPDKLYSFLNKHGYYEQDEIVNMYDKMFTKVTNRVNRTIYNILPFYNELDLLELRLQENYDYVDKFIIVEASQTHSGNSKKSFYLENIDRYKNYQDKIIHMICDFDSDLYNSQKLNNPHYKTLSEQWIRESFQRDYAILSNAIDFKETDVLIVTDADEIQNSKTVKEFLIKNPVIKHPKRLAMYLMHYYINTYIYDIKYPEKWSYIQWTHPYIIQYSDLTKYHNSLSFYRTECDVYNPDYITEGGWHFSYLFNTDGILNKVRNFAHYEDYNMKNVHVGDINKSIDNLTIFYDTKFQLKMREFPIHNLPNSILNNLDKWEKFLLKKKSLVVIGAYPNTEEGIRVLKNTIASLRNDFDILLSTHYPVDKDIQEMVKYYVYDYRNEIIPPAYESYTWWWANDEFYFQKYETQKTKNHNYAIYRLIVNALNLIKDSYEDFYYIEADCTFGKPDLEKLKSMKEDSIKQNKTSCFFTTDDSKFVFTLVFWSNIKNFCDVVSLSSTPEEFVLNSNGKNAIEYFIGSAFEKYDSYWSSVNRFININPVQYFTSSQINQLTFENEECINAHISSGAISVVKEIDSNNIFFIYSGYGHSDDMKIKLNGNPFVITNYLPGQTIYKQIDYNSDKIEIEINGHKKEYLVDNILSNNTDYIKFFNKK